MVEPRLVQCRMQDQRLSAFLRFSHKAWWYHESGGCDANWMLSWPSFSIIRVPTVVLKTDSPL